MNKKYLMYGGIALVVIAIAYYFWNKKKQAPSVTGQAASDAANSQTVSSQIASIPTASIQSATPQATTITQSSNAATQSNTAANTSFSMNAGNTNAVSNFPKSAAKKIISNLNLSNTNTALA
jgi:hypothetical protein